MHGIFAHSTNWVQLLCKRIAALGDVGGISTLAGLASPAIGMSNIPEERDSRAFSSTRVEDLGLKKRSRLLFPVAATDELLNTRSQIKWELWDAEVPAAPQLMRPCQNRTDFGAGTPGALFAHTATATPARWAVKMLLRLRHVYFWNKFISYFCDKSVLFF